MILGIVLIIRKIWKSIVLFRNSAYYIMKYKIVVHVWVSDAKKPSQLGFKQFLSFGVSWATDPFLIKLLIFSLVLFISMDSLAEIYGISIDYFPDLISLYSISFRDSWSSFCIKTLSVDALFYHVMGIFSIKSFNSSMKSIKIWDS